MTAKPRKKKLTSGAILILLSRTDTINSSLGQAIVIFDGADANDSNWPSSLSNLATAIENAASDVQANDFTSGDWSNAKGAIDDALENYLENEN